MVKALISINVQLESSIALRYSKELSRRIDLRLQEVHVIESDRSGPTPGHGWVKQTWENASIDTATKEIRQFLSMENLDLKRLRDTEILIGDRTEKLLEKLLTRQYNLFIEGALPTFDTADFYSRVRSRLYSTMPCPALVVKNLVSLDKAAMLVDAGDTHSPVSGFLKIFGSSAIGIDAFVCKTGSSGNLEVKDAEDAPAWLDEAFRTADEQGVRPGIKAMLKGPAEAAAQYLRAYGLVVASLPRNPEANEPKLEILARAQSPVLICWAEK
ncbi:MAG: hypothetical protein ACOC7W_03180 [Desulfosalsimonas sp.]